MARTGLSNLTFDHLAATPNEKWALGYSVQRSNGRPRFIDEVFKKLASTNNGDSLEEYLASNEALVYDGQIFHVVNPQTYEVTNYYAEWDSSNSKWVAKPLDNDTVVDKAVPMTEQNAALGTVMPINKNTGAVTADENCGTYEQEFAIVGVPDCSTGLPVDMDKHGHIYVPLTDEMLNNIMNGGAGEVDVADPWTENDTAGIVIPTNLNSGTVTVEEGSEGYEETLEISKVDKPTNALPVDMDKDGHIYVPLTDEMYNNIMNGGAGEVDVADPWTSKNIAGTVIPTNLNTGTVTCENEKEEDDTSYQAPIEIKAIEDELSSQKKNPALPVDMDEAGHLYVPLTDTMYDNIVNGGSVEMDKASPWTATNVLGAVIPTNLNTGTVSLESGSEEADTSYRANIEIKSIEADLDTELDATNPALPVDMDEGGHLYVPLTDTMYDNIVNGGSGGGSEVGMASPWSEEDELGTVIPIHQNGGRVTYESSGGLSESVSDNLEVIRVAGAGNALPVDMTDDGHIYVPLTRSMFLNLNTMGVPLKQFVQVYTGDADTYTGGVVSTGGGLLLADPIYFDGYNRLPYVEQNSFEYADSQGSDDENNIYLHVGYSNTFYFLNYDEEHERANIPTPSGLTADDGSARSVFVIDPLDYYIDNTVVLFNLKLEEADRSDMFITLQIGTQSEDSILSPDTLSSIEIDGNHWYWVEFHHGFCNIHEVQNPMDIVSQFDMITIINDPNNHGQFPAHHTHRQLVNSYHSDSVATNSTIIDYQAYGGPRPSWQ